VSLSAEPGAGAQTRLAGQASAETYLAITPSPSKFVAGTSTAEQVLTVTNLSSNRIASPRIAVDTVPSPFIQTNDCSNWILEPCGMATSVCTVRVRYVATQTMGTVGGTQPGVVSAQLPRQGAVRQPP